MATPKPVPHHYALKTTWTGASQGTTSHYRGYSREHLVEFEGKPAITCSSDPAFLGDPKLLNPEEMLVAALSTCHMLSYLALASLEHLEVVAYEDSASGTMLQEGTGGRFTDVLLRPRVTVKAGTDLTRAEALHGNAHRTCFIANSVSFPVRHEAEILTAEES